MENENENENKLEVELNEQDTMTEEAKKARVGIAKMYTKEQLVQKSLDSFNQLVEVLKLVAIALPDTDKMSPIKREMVMSASGRKLQNEARAKIWEMVDSYNKAISNIIDNKD